MTVVVHQFPCLEDNYAFLVHDSVSGETACIDTLDAHVIVSELTRLNWTLTAILNTHWHRDHTGGNDMLREATGARVLAPAEVLQRSTVDHIVRDGDIITMGSMSFQMIETAGHTLGHVCYLEPTQLLAFVGDTLFALGCGRLFEGTAAQMWASLRKLAALPKQTKVYCAHEYTLANAEFALSVASSPAPRKGRLSFLVAGRSIDAR